MPRLHSDRCCNPYDKTGHKGKNLRRISTALKRKFPDLDDYAKICATCRMNKKQRLDNDTSNIQLNLEETCNEIDNNILNSSEPSSISSSASRLSDSSIQSQREIELEEMLQGLKEKFFSLKNTDPRRLTILTTVPDSWSLNKISREFRCSKQFAKKARQLKVSSGILADTTKKKGNRLPEETIQRINDFYNSDENSRIMPGMKEVVSIVTENGKESIQKRLLLLDLRELYDLYSKENSDCPVSFSKFAQQRPKYCILTGASGTHSVCVCVTHQNCKLMIDAINLKKLTKGTPLLLHDYKSCLSQIVCTNANSNCYIGECKNCPGISKLEEFLKQLLREKLIDHVQFSAWTNTDRSTLQTQICSSEEIVEILCNSLLILKPHSFIAKEQSGFFQEMKKNLKLREALIVLDFSENYKYVVQDASQAFHFNNSQCTVLPIVCYYRKASEIEHKSFIFLSNSTLHDTAAVYTVQKMLIPELKKIVSDLQKVIYYSDGAKQHFKNKYQMRNLMHHEEDFAVQAEWHFHATAHGKGASDGIGAVFKREAVRASLLSKPSDAILTFEKLSDWGKKRFEKVKVLCYTDKEQQKTKRFLNKRFDSAPPVPQISKNHCFIPNSDKELVIKRYSKDTEKSILSYRNLK